jgi:hypothetical protein
MPGRNGSGPMGPCSTAGLGMAHRCGFRGGFAKGFACVRGLPRKELLQAQKELLQKRIDGIDRQLTAE